MFSLLEPRGYAERSGIWEMNMIGEENGEMAHLQVPETYCRLTFPCKACPKTLVWLHGFPCFALNLGPEQWPWDIHKASRLGQTCKGAPARKMVLIHVEEKVLLEQMKGTERKTIDPMIADKYLRWLNKAYRSIYPGR